MKKKTIQRKVEKKREREKRGKIEIYLCVGISFQAPSYCI